MHQQSEKYFQVLKFIAEEQQLDYAKSEKDLMSSVKPIQTFAIKKENSTPLTQNFYRKFNILYILLIPVSVFISVGARQFFTLYNYLGVFLLSMVGGIVLITLIHQYEKKFNLVLCISPDGITMSGKHFKWENVENIYLYSDTSYFRKYIKYHLIICTDHAKTYMSELTSTSISKIADGIVNNWKI